MLKLLKTAPKSPPPSFPGILLKGIVTSRGTVNSLAAGTLNSFDFTVVISFPSIYTMMFSGITFPPKILGFLKMASALRVIYFEFNASIFIFSSF